MKKTATAELIGSIDDMLRAVKKTASTLSEPGSIGGETTHTTKNLDDGLQDATEGARSQENTKDVKDQIGPASVDSSPTNPGTQQAQQMDIGVTSKPVGSDPANETGSAKAGKDDPGSSHPARTDNDSLDGHKYASLSEMLKQAADLGNKVMAAMATPEPAQAPATPSKTAADAADAERAAQAGYDTAAAATAGFDKVAFDQQLVHEVAETVAIARRRAVKVAEALTAMVQAQKAAGSAGEDGANPPMAGGEAGGEEGGELSDEELLAALGGGGGGEGGAPGGDPGMGAGGMPGGDPGMGAGGMPGPGGDPSMGGDPGMGGEGGGGPEDETAMLLHVLEQAGITPEQLQALVSKQAAADLVKAANKKPSKSAWKPKTATDKRAADEALAYVRELIKNNS